MWRLSVSKSRRVLLDLNNTEFQDNLLSLDNKEVRDVLSTLRKIRRLTWEEVYKDKGLNWELIQTRSAPDGSRLYTIRVTQKIRAVVCRQGELMRFVSIHSDHDSAYH